MEMEELLDIVNEQDEVVGKDTRKNVHDRHEIHRGVHVFVINSSGKVLLQKRSEKKDYYPGYFDASVGAQVFSGESYGEAATRETKEELGFKPDKLEFICDYKSYSERQRENRRLFVCYSEGPFKIDKGELESIEFYNLDVIQKEINDGKMKFTEGFKISFTKYLKWLDKKAL